MLDTSRGIVAVAVEDDAIRIAYSLIDLLDDRWDEPSFGDLEDMPAARERLPVFRHVEEIVRPQFDPMSPTVHTDVRLVEPARVVSIIQEYIEDVRTTGWRVDAVGLSIFGAVSRDNGNWRFVPNRGDRIAGELQECNFPREIKKVTGVEYVFVDNDASAAALGEQVWGAGLGQPDAFAYVWLGRGVNVGLVLGNGVWEGFLHPEMGHIYPRYHDKDEAYLRQCRDKDDPAPRCILHRDCLMAMTTYRAIIARLHSHEMPYDLVSDIQAYYVAQLCHTLTQTLSPGRIAIGGMQMRTGLWNGHQFLDKVRSEWVQLRGDKRFGLYAQIGKPENFIVEARLGQAASLLGTFENARRLLTKQMDLDARLA